MYHTKVFTFNSIERITNERATDNKSHVPKKPSQKSLRILYFKRAYPHFLVDYVSRLRPSAGVMQCNHRAGSRENVPYNALGPYHGFKLSHLLSCQKKDIFYR